MSNVFPSRPVEEAPSQPTIDTEVEELARELFVRTCKVDDYYELIMANPVEYFNAAELFIKFRNERRASHGKP